MIRNLWRWLFDRRSEQPKMLYLGRAAGPVAQIQAMQLLAQDPDDDVRAEVAAKIGRLLPGLSEQDRERLRDLALEVLERLANDQLVRVRQILAEEIKRSDLVPKAIVMRLAHDVESAVSAPVLEYSPLLNDQDLLEIITQGAIESALPAIARRADLSPVVADAVVATLDVPAVASLLSNKSIEIREETLDRVIDHAAEIKAWHGPLTLRAELSLRAVRRIGGFVASSLLSQLQERRGLDDETAAYLARRVRERLAEEEIERGRDFAEILRQALKRGEVDDTFVVAAMDAKDKPLVVHALAALARVPVVIVERVLDGSSAKAIVALCWHAGLSMRTAFKMQALSGRIAQKDFIPARHGTDYPMTTEEMIFQLELFGIQPSA